MPEDKECTQIREFYKKFGMLSFTRPVKLATRKLVERAEFLQEELDEFKKAAVTGNYHGLVDALVDLVYVAKGTAVSMGIPWEQAFDEVQRANMDKVPGTTKRGNIVDAAKPEGWKEPDFSFINPLEPEIIYDDEIWCEEPGLEDLEITYRAFTKGFYTAQVRLGITKLEVSGATPEETKYKIYKEIVNYMKEMKDAQTDVNNL